MSDVPSLREVWRITSTGDGADREFVREDIESVLRVVRNEMTARARLIKIKKVSA